MRRFKCCNLGSPGPESTAPVEKEPRRPAPPKKQYQSGPDLVFGKLSTSVADHHVEREQKRGFGRRESCFSPCVVFSETLVLTRMEELCTAAAKYKDEDQLANGFKESLYSTLCSAKGLGFFFLNGWCCAISVFIWYKPPCQSGPNNQSLQFNPASFVKRRVTAALSRATLRGVEMLRTSFWKQAEKIARDEIARTLASGSFFLVMQLRRLRFKWD